MSKMNRKLKEQRLRDDAHGHHEVPVDALVYARLLGARQIDRVECTLSAPDVEFVAPTVAQRRLMATLGIDLDSGGYRFDAVRYERLSDALDQAISPAWREAPSGP